MNVFEKGQTCGLLNSGLSCWKIAKKIKRSKMWFYKDLLKVLKVASRIVLLYAVKDNKDDVWFASVSGCARKRKIFYKSWGSPQMWVNKFLKYSIRGHSCRASNEHAGHPELLTFHPMQ